MSRPDLPLKDLHRDWCGAVERAAPDLAPARTFPVGYEHAYETTEGGVRRLAIVCPWHWRQYSHYQFWELAAVPFLARAAGYRDCALLTNGAWTAWCLPALRALFGAVLEGERADVVRSFGDWLGSPPRDQRLPAGRPPGRLLLGPLDPDATTVSTKDALAREYAGRLRASPPVATALPGVSLRSAFIAEGGSTLVVVKAFRNPDPTHEAKMLAGRGYLCPPDHRLVAVVDGRLDAAAPLIAASGATVCTPDRLSVALAGGPPPTISPRANAD